MAAVLVEHSSYNRAQLKQRLYAMGLKNRQCELCGQGEIWRDQFMGLILDHINGVPNDNRLENLRIVCPNCNATLDTHCGRHNRRPVTLRECLHCGRGYAPRYPTQRYCSRACGIKSPSHSSVDSAKRKVERPPYDQLMAELAEAGFSAVGRKYGVSDNAVRKWVLRYEREIAESEPPGDEAG